MEPIISPWIIYMLPFVNIFIALMKIIAVLTLLMLVVVYTDKDFRADRGTKLTKAIGAVFIISTLIAIFIPTKEVLIAMYIANHATPENIQMLINTFIK
jgi:hypothetical protein|nr:MAG TPA: hypothetical protein [Caudoviricetes sp.]